LGDADVEEMERRDRENFLDRFTTNHFAVDGALAVSEDQR
jgi:hypothetical protein